MNNRERDLEIEQYYLYIALRRKKENELKELCFRQIIRDEAKDLHLLKEKIKDIPGVWRIYKTVNARKVAPALKLLQHRLIDEPERFAYRIDSLWKNCLLQKQCKGERNFLIDVDCEDFPTELIELITNGSILVDEKILTPNGWHLICKDLDTRLLQGIPNIEVKRDDIKFVELIYNETN